MSRFPRFSRLSLVGIAGIGALLLIPADETQRRINSLSARSAPAEANADIAAPAQTRGIDAVETSAVPGAGETTQTAVASVAPDELAPAVAGASPVATAEETPSRTLWVGGSAVNVRVGPSSSTARLFVLVPGQKVSASESVGGWTLIVASNGESGWVASRYLSDVASSKKAAPPKAAEPQETTEPRQGTKLKFTQLRSRVTLRARPSWLAPRLAVLRPGERIAVIETRGRWVRVVLESGVSAWIDGRDL